MEAVAFGGKDASESISGTDWSNLQFNKQPDKSNRVSLSIKQIIY